MNETQQHLLRLLAEIDELCSEHGLTYYLAGGCAIGVFRHRGFLPWDDDADILMPFEDAQRLKELELRGLLQPNRAVIGFSDYGFSLVFRYVDTSTSTFYRGTYAYEDYPNGQFVDILTLSPGPDDDVLQDAFVDEFQVAKNIRTDWNNTAGMTRDARIKLKKRWNPFTRLLGKEVVSQHYQRRLFYSGKWDDCDTVFVCSPEGPQFLDKQLLDSGTIRLPFENIHLNVYGRTREGLALSYGSNWVEIPSSAAMRRVNHMIFTDLSFPYPLVQRDIGKVSNLALTRFMNRGVKATDYHNAVVRYDTSYGIAEFETILRTHQIEGIWNEADIDVDAMEQTQDFAAADSLFVRYYGMLKWPRLSFLKRGLPINDDALWAAWYPQFQRGNYLAALKAIRQVLSAEDEMSPRLKTLFESCVDADEYMSAFWSLDDYDVARDVIAKHRDDEYPSVVFLRGFLAMDIHDAKSSNDYERIHRVAVAALKAYPGDGELLYWDGLTLLELGRRDEALARLRAAADHAINGIVRLMAGDILHDEFRVG